MCLLVFVLVCDLPRSKQFLYLACFCICMYSEIMSNIFLTLEASGKLNRKYILCTSTFFQMFDICLVFKIKYCVIHTLQYFCLIGEGKIMIIKHYLIILVQCCFHSLSEPGIMYTMFQKRKAQKDNWKLKDRSL